MTMKGLACQDKTFLDLVTLIRQIYVAIKNADSGKTGQKCQVERGVNGDDWWLKENVEKFLIDNRNAIGEVYIMMMLLLIMVL